ncbi:MAG: class C sortase [Clostridiales bacterium]|nr:class C sortase [Clostridiales bacterium]
MNRVVHERAGGKLKVGCIVLFLLGLGILLYPTISSRWNKWRQEQLVSDYSSAVSDLEEEGADLSIEWARARAYNDALLPSILPDSFAIAEAQEEPGEEYMACLNLSGDGVMGYLSIPKLDLKLPIYHTTSEEVLQEGVGHLEGSSLPVGGENTHAVLAAHRGLPNAELFTNLDQMEEGDHFLIYVLDEVLCYEVDQITVVEPTETDALSVEDGQDLVTLLTCTPYGVNTQRLLVRGHRVDYDEEAVEDEAGTANLITHTNYALWALGGLMATAAVISLFCLLQRRRGKPEKKK